MVDVARVKMFGMNIGTFKWDDTYDMARFEYDEHFVGKGLGAITFDDASEAGSYLFIWESQ